MLEATSGWVPSPHGTVGRTGSQTYLIGDGLRTDSRAIHAVGGHFIPIEELRHKPIATLSTWIL